LAAAGSGVAGRQGGRTAAALVAKWWQRRQHGNLGGRAATVVAIWWQGWQRGSNGIRAAEARRWQAARQRRL
jgi:hypothetical protein